MESYGGRSQITRWIEELTERGPELSPGSSGVTVSLLL